MSRRITHAVLAGLLLLGGAEAAPGSSPYRWQVSVGPEAVLTLRGGARAPFSASLNPSPALHPTDLFPLDAAARKQCVLRGEVRVYFAVVGFGADGTGAETSVHEVVLEELKLERVDDGKAVRWRIPESEYGALLKRLQDSKSSAPRGK